MISAFLGGKLEGVVERCFSAGKKGKMMQPEPQRIPGSTRKRWEQKISSRKHGKLGYEMDPIAFIPGEWKKWKNFQKKNTSMKVRTSSYAVNFCGGAWLKCPWKMSFIDMSGKFCLWCKEAIKKEGSKLSTYVHLVRGKPKKAGGNHFSTQDRIIFLFIFLFLVFPNALKWFSPLNVAKRYFYFLSKAGFCPKKLWTKSAGFSYFFVEQFIEKQKKNSRRWKIGLRLRLTWYLRQKKWKWNWITMVFLFLVFRPHCIHRLSYPL